MFGETLRGGDRKLGEEGNEHEASQLELAIKELTNRSKVHITQSEDPSHSCSRK